jgi:DnaK suppressor protein
MNYSEIDQLKETLSQWLVSYDMNSNDIMAQASEPHGNMPDPVDRASFQSEMEYIFSRLGRDSYNKNNILRALTKIEKGMYGVCEECGEEIPVNRLRAIPDTSYCLACQTELETNGL